MLPWHRQARSSGSRRDRRFNSDPQLLESSREKASVSLSSAEYAALAAILGKLPRPEEFLQFASQLNGQRDEICRYLHFDELPAYTEASESAKLPVLESFLVHGALPIDDWELPRSWLTAGPSVL